MTMIEKQETEALIYQQDTALLDIDLLSASEFQDQINHSLRSLINSPVNKLVIQGKNMTESQAVIVLDFLKANPTLILDVDLPEELQNSKVQVELDNLISNRRLEFNRQLLSGGSTSAADQAPKEAKKRTLPKRKSPPPIVITLSDNDSSDDESESDVAHHLKQSGSLATTPTTPVIELPKLQRLPMAAQVVAEILSLVKQDQTQWNALTNRDEALEYRKNLGAQFTKENHPLRKLIANNAEVNLQFSQWENKFKFEKEQYDALLDVYGQYGVPGLTKLFQTWNEYISDSYKGPVFLETYFSLLKHMPSFLPFIEDKAFQDTISKIANLSKEHRSWWMALIKNHGQTAGYSNLPGLFKQFMDAVTAIEQMGLTFYEIDSIRDVKDLPTSLNELLALLHKCPKQDQVVQWRCFDSIIIPSTQPNDFHFIIPEMKAEENLGVKAQLEWIKDLLNQNKDTNPELIKSAFYQYIAKRTQHLPIEQYRNILDEVLSNNEIKNEIKTRLIYILAKTTSTDDKTGFDAVSVREEWELFKNALFKMDSLERLKANRSYVGRKAMETHISAKGGVTGIQNQTLLPIMAMAVTPPMSYLNKLLRLSEYKFLDEKNSLLDLENIQKDMMQKMDTAALFYQSFPESMMYAIRLIKTDVVQKNAYGHYIPEQEDISLLAQFINASGLFIDPKYNTLSASQLNPQNILLPLLTTFHLEYETTERLIKEVIEPYKKRLTNPVSTAYQEKLHNLLPYGLSLLKLIQSRTKPSRLDYLTLNKIQDDLIGLICRPEPTTKKEIRAWMHEHYGVYFDGTVLLDMRDAVNFTSLFEELQFTEIETRSLIEQVVSNFDNEEEKDEHQSLVVSLIKLAKTLSPTQKAAFFDYCQEAFKTGGVLSRDKHPGPPSYLSQFQSLVDNIAKINAYEEFEQYMRIAQDHQIMGLDATNSLAKCNYLLDSLYPALLQKGATRKEAFTFSAELVSLSSLSSLNSSHREANLPIPDSDELSQISEAFEDLTYNRSSAAPLDKLKKLQNALNAAVKLAKNEGQLVECRTISNRTDEIIKAIETRTQEEKVKNSGWRQRVVSWFWAPASYTPAPTEDELNSLVELGLNQHLFSNSSSTYKEIQEIKANEIQSFQNIVVHLQTKKAELVNHYGNIATRATVYVTSALKQSPEDVGKNHNDVCQLIDSLIALDDQNLVLSLMYHYSGGLPERDVKDLISIFNSREYQQLPGTVQKDFLNAIITQMNNSVKCSKADTERFLAFIYANKENHTAGYLQEFYQHAPYPQLNRFMDWMSLPASEITDQYQHFDKHPCALGPHDGREAENNFKIDEAMATLKHMPEVHHIFNPAYLTEVTQEQRNVQELSTQQLLDELKTYKTITPKNHIKMVIYAAELLHRCKGRTPEFVGQTQVLGRSYELNTTQIIAILSILETGNKVTAGIGTGEGKSRIMMLLNACQFLKGKTVDFLTSNISLAERDYLESLPFFASLGAEINLITSASKIEDYKMNGINVSDPENFCLFRNKAFEQKKLNLVTHKDPTKRALLLDEADVAYFDVSHLEYNSSSVISQIEIELLPFYPLLMDFFAQSETEKTYLENKERCNQQLLDFVEARNPQLVELLKTMPVARLEQLQDSAYTARHLDYGVDYTVVSEAVSQTALGEKKVAAAMCLIGSRISKEAEFANGIHQCLHAELNRLMKVQNPEIEDPTLKEALDECKAKNRVFNIDPMKKVTFRSSSNNLLKTYEQGTLHAVTGTIGSKTEQYEARNEFGVQFIHVPRHKGMRRLDRTTQVAHNEEKQLDAMVKHILKSNANNQPVLLICKNDNQSKRLHEELERRLSGQRTSDGRPNLTRIHAGTDYSTSISEANYIKNEAGKPGQVTITTEMEGRGVDIHLQGKAHNSGLKVLLSYLPHGERSYGQIVGRSGRYGAIGETQMVLNLESLKEEFGIDHLNTDFYLNPEDFIKKLQIFASHTQELRRLFYRAYDNYLSSFSERYKALQAQGCTMVAAWSDFLEQYKQSKDHTYKVIEAQLEHSNPNVHIINEQLEIHNQKVKELWRAFTDQLPEDKRGVEQQLPVHDLKKPKILSHWLKELEQIKQESVLVKDVLEVRVRENYDSTVAGSMQVVKNPSFVSSMISDIRAAWRNEGIVFPNLRAWWSGQLSFHNFLSQLPFFRLFLTARDESHVVQRRVASSHAVLFKELVKDDDDDASNVNQSEHAFKAEEQNAPDVADEPPAKSAKLFKPARPPRTRETSDESRLKPR